MTQAAGILHRDPDLIAQTEALADHAATRASGNRLLRGAEAIDLTGFEEVRAVHRGESEVFGHRGPAAVHVYAGLATGRPR